MEVLIHYLNGNDLSIQNHYAQKEYRNDIIIEIDKLFYEVYFYVEGSIEYELTNEGFFSLPGLIVLDEISNEKILNSINKLIDYKYFEHFVGKKEFPLKSRFIDRWYVNDLSFDKSVKGVTYKLR